MAIIPDGSKAEEIAALMAWEDDVSDEERSQRSEELDNNLMCFVTFGGYEDAILGLGLYIHPRTAWQKYSCIPGDYDFVCDYLDVDAFNEGIRRASLKKCTVDELPSMVSSSRKKLNGWLPLYINSGHWASAKPYVESAFLRLADHYEGTNFHPALALDVCSRLLTCAVVGFLKGQSPLADSRTMERSVVSQRSVQMYADVHRLLLQMVRDYPEIERIATRRLTQFMKSPKQRTRSVAPDLGDLIQCLLISNDVSWDDLAPTLIPEAMRRQVARSLREHRYFDPWSSPLDVADISELVKAWDVFAPQCCTVTFMCISFCKLVGRPQDMSLEDVVLAYDKRWGRLGDEVVNDILKACLELRRRNSIESFFPSLLPGALSQSFEEAVCTVKEASMCQSKEMKFLAECILWASWYGWNSDTEHIRASEWPSIKGAHKLLAHWCNMKVWQSPDKRQWRVKGGARL